MLCTHAGLYEDCPQKYYAKEHDENSKYHCDVIHYSYSGVFKKLKQNQQSAESAAHPQTISIMSSVYKPPHAIKSKDSKEKVIIQPKYESMTEFPSLASPSSSPSPCSPSSPSYRQNQGYEEPTVKPTMNYRGFLDETERKNQENLKRLSLDPETTNKILRKSGWEIFKLTPSSVVIKRFAEYINSNEPNQSPNQLPNHSHTTYMLQQQALQESEKRRIHESTIHEESEDDIEIDLNSSYSDDENGHDSINHNNDIYNSINEDLN
jgi:hypothetical protein